MLISKLLFLGGHPVLPVVLVDAPTAVVVVVVVVVILLYGLKARII